MFKLLVKVFFYVLPLGFMVNVRKTYLIYGISKRKEAELFTIMVRKSLAKCLTLCILVDFHIHIETISMRLSI